MMKKLFCLAMALLLLLSVGCAKNASSGEGSGSTAAGSTCASSSVQTEGEPVDLLTLLSDILNTAPGSAGCSLRQARAAGELLDWAQMSGTAEPGEVERWMEGKVSSGADMAYAWAAVLDSADQLLSGGGREELADAGYTLLHDTYEEAAFQTAVRSLSPLFTRLLDETPGSAYAQEAGTDWGGVTLDRLDGIWRDSETKELLIFSGEHCRVVIPSLDEYGETAYSARIRDRSAVGYCPALEIDHQRSGRFDAPLTYYVSGVDETHFWSNTQGQRFEKIPLE